MNESAGMHLKPDPSGGNLFLRHAAAAFGVFAMYCGITFIVGYIGSGGQAQGCSHRFPRAWGGTFVTPGVGAALLIAGSLILGWLDRGGWSGPADAFAGTSLWYGSAGTTVAFLSKALKSDGVMFKVLCVGVSLGCFAIFSFFTREIWRIVRRDGLHGYLKWQYWVLETLPESKKARKRLLARRGLAAGRVRDGRLVPETVREKFHWCIFMTEMCLAVVVGIGCGVFLSMGS